MAADLPLSGRVEERATLARLVASPKAELLALYGRRRVGKTFLVRRFFRDAPVVMFEMVGRFGASVEQHLQIFAESLSRAFYGGASVLPPASWHDAFRALEAAVEARRRSGKKTVFFFDELPWIATHRSGVLAELEHFWNAWCSKRSDVIVVVCGSSASWMLKKIVHARGGLHNRVTQTMRLLPFTLAEVKTFLHDRKLSFTNRDVVELTMALGGVPHYLDHVVRGRSVTQTIDRICLAKDAPLAGEFERVFASLFDDDAKYKAAVRALAKKRRGLTRNELLAELDLPSGGGATTILGNLAEAGFISESIPFGRASRDRFFRLTDEFSLFHLKWLDGTPPKSWQAVRKTPRWEAWAGLAFESLCLENVDAIERALGISGVETRASAWLHANAQIDLLIDRADSVISLCEVKFTEGPFAITKKYAAELRNKIAVFREETKTKKTVQLVFIASSGLRENEYSTELVDQTLTLESLFGQNT